MTFPHIGITLLKLGYFINLEFSKQWGQFLLQNKKLFLNRFFCSFLSFSMLVLSSFIF